MDHRSNVTVNGQSFRDWFIHDYMISNETLFHKNPVTGEPQMISLGWMDVSFHSPMPPPPRAVQRLTPTHPPYPRRTR